MKVESQRGVAGLTRAPHRRFDAPGLRVFRYLEEATG